MEKRYASEIRAIQGRKLAGYAAKFGTEARLGKTVETIAKGAFRASLGHRDILCLADHDASKVLGRTKTGTLKLEEDDQGLRFELDLPNTTTGNDVLELVQRGDAGGMSFGFHVKRQSWAGDRRTLEEVDLREVSIVSAWPAYQGTTVEARSQQRQNKAQRYLETV
jgi:uncharacterized protein